MGVGLLVVVFLLAGCGTSPRSASGTSSPVSSTFTTTTTATTIPSTSDTGSVIVNPPTTIVTYPHPYKPAYDTPQSLVNDSLFILAATLGSEGSYGGAEEYPLNVKTVFSYTEVRMFVAVAEEEVEAVHLTVGGEYLLFYAADTTDRMTCIVGGVRGVFQFDAQAQTVTRISTNSDSMIPKTQSVKAFSAALAAAVKVAASRELQNSPPTCLPAATGL